MHTQDTSESLIKPGISCLPSIDNTNSFFLSTNFTASSIIPHFTKLGIPVLDFLSVFSSGTAKLKFPVLGSYLDLDDLPEFTCLKCLSEENSHNVHGPPTKRTVSQNKLVSFRYRICVVLTRENTIVSLL